ncbi:MAG: hypothetical protein OXB90_03410 [Acidimicrobiaceae bacterium]|nr:hypothetical protein [Acidimicrobiaceae bacterium]
MSSWLDDLPAESFFRTSDVPGRSRGAVRTFLSREVSKTSPRVMKAAANLYWKPGPPNSITGRACPPGFSEVGWEVAGEHAAALGWYGANIVGWSDQVALQYLEFAVPGEPPSRHPHPRVTIRSRRNLARQLLTRLEATYLEAVVGFDVNCEIDWDDAVHETRFRLRRSFRNGQSLPRAAVLGRVAAQEQPRRNGELFRSRIGDLVAAMAEAEQHAATQRHTPATAAA